MRLITRSPRSDAPPSRARRILLLAGATAGNVVLLSMARHSVGSVLLVLAAALLAGLLVLFERREPRLGIAPVAAAIAIVIAASVATPRAPPTTCGRTRCTAG